MYQGNRLHGASHDEDGINKYHTDTPLYCEKCGSYYQDHGWRTNPQENNV